MITRLFRPAGAFLLVLCVFLITLVPIVLADYDYQYENLTTGDDAEAEAYGVNWFGQVFTGESPHSITDVKLLIYREGSPGTITLSLRGASADKPTGGDADYVDIASATYDGDTVTTSSSGEWITFAMLPELDIPLGGDFALVLRAPAGDATNSIHWLYDGTSTAGDDNYASSTNSGASWIADTSYDFMYDIYGYEPVDMYDVAIFSSVIEDGDWLVCLYYRCTPSPYYPGYAVGDYMDLVLYEPSAFDPVAKIPLPAWGYKPVGMYLSPDHVSSLETEYGFTWGSLGKIGIIGREDAWGDDGYIWQASLWPQYWAGSDDFLIDEWVRTVAEDMETYYGAGLFYTEEIDTGTDSITFDAGEGILTPIGGEIFTEGIPGLEEIRPELFYYVYHELEPGEVTYDPKYQNVTTWQAQVGPEVAALLTAGGNVINLDGNAFGGAAIGVVYIAIVGIFVRRLRENAHSFQVSGAIATGLAIPVVLSGLYLRLLPWELAAIVSTTLFFGLMWFIWLSRT